MHDNPDWPNQALLERRRQDAIAADPDDADVLAQCAAAPVTEAPALLRCAAALADAGQGDAAAADARQAWVSGLATRRRRRRSCTAGLAVADSGRPMGAVPAPGLA